MDPTELPGLLAHPQQLGQRCVLLGTVIDAEGALGGESRHSSLSSLPTLGWGFLGLEQRRGVPFGTSGGGSPVSDRKVLNLKTEDPGPGLAV